ncbi:hypothetical protein E2320_000728 [Naja naja]|nr:hypothetical protein E2320_000728 [Naja naja]
MGWMGLILADDIPNPTDCSWFRGKDQREEGRIFRAKFNRTRHSYLIDLKGAAHRGREEVWRACALVIQKVEASDAGPYTISMGDEWDARPTTGWKELRVPCQREEQYQEKDDSEVQVDRKEGRKKGTNEGDDNEKKEMGIQEGKKEGREKGRKEMGMRKKSKRRKEERKKERKKKRARR